MIEAVTRSKGLVSLAKDLGFNDVEFRVFGEIENLRQEQNFDNF